MTISENANKWLEKGQRGISSEAIFSKLTGLNIVGHWGYCPPSDPSDLVRCELLLRQVPEFRERMNEVAEMSAQWKALVDNWDELVQLLESEVPGVFMGTFGKANKTYLRMLELRKGL